MSDAGLFAIVPALDAHVAGEVVDEMVADMMNMLSTKVSPPNSLILIADRQGEVVVPDAMPGSRIVATGSSIVVGCKADMGRGDGNHSRSRT